MVMTRWLYWLTNSALGEILDSLMRSLSDGELDDNADFIARMLDFDFESEE